MMGRTQEGYQTAGREDGVRVRTTATMRQGTSFVLPVYHLLSSSSPTTMVCAGGQGAEEVGEERC
jgi:hypothetical protein